MGLVKLLNPRRRSGMAAAAALMIASLVTTACDRGAHATIVSPIDHAHYLAGDSIWFQGEVSSDLREPLGIAVEGDWRWTSDLDGELGARALFRRHDLSLGEHIITLRVRNDRDLVLRDQVRIVVVRAR